MARRFTWRRSDSYDPGTWIDPADLAIDPPDEPARALPSAQTLLCLASAALLLAGAVASWATRVSEPTAARPSE